MRDDDYTAEAIDRSNGLNLSNMTKADDIVGYTFRAENLCGGCTIERLIAVGLASPAAREMSVEAVLDAVAEVDVLDRHDEHSFDSHDFPKVIFAIELEDDYCNECGHAF